MRKVFALFFLISASFAFAQPKLEIKDSKKNFGFVKKGEVVRINYEITNKGKEPLLINDIEIECSCTKAEFDKKPILPLQSATVTIIFDTQPVYDRQDRTVKIISNDPAGAQKLRYKGVVLR